MNTDLEPYQGGTPEPSSRPQVPSIASDIVPPRLPEVGRIRCGEKETKTVIKGGKQVEVTFPKRLGTFRFTSRERPLIEQVAKLYGGIVKPWASDEGPQWQVTSEANSIEVIVPTADLAFSQYFELWDGGGCQRRCDGHYEMLGDSQCRCNPADRKAGKEGSCKPTTRLGVFLPGVKGLGVWRLESHGKNAGSEIKGSVMLIAAYGAGLTRATLTTAIRPGRQRKPDGTFTPVRYVVPTLISSDDIGEYVDRAQLEASPVQGVLPAPFEYLDPRDDLVKALHATYREIYPKEADESPENYRGRRLMWSEQVLSQGQTQWRVIPSWNGPEAPETLTRADVQTLLDALESTPALTRGRAAPISPGAPSAAGADSIPPYDAAECACGHMAGEHDGPLGECSSCACRRWIEGSAGDDAQRQAPADPRYGGGRPQEPTAGRDRQSHTPAEHHPQGSAGVTMQAPAQASPETPPAEHHTDEAKGSASADGTVPAGESRSDTGPPGGAAPAKSAPTRKRRPTDPTGAPKVAEAIKEAQQFRDNRKTQTEVERIPADPIQAMPPTFRELFLKHFGNELEPALSAVNAHIIEWGPKYPATGDAAPWSLELLQELAADTFEKDMYR